MLRPKTVVENVIVHNVSPSYTQMKRLSNILKTNNIYNNGKLVIRCKQRLNIKKVKNKISEILDVNKRYIYLTYYETKW